MITNDPLNVKVGKIPMQIDLGADKLIGAERGGEKMPKLVYTIHTKTQRGGADMHIAIVKLLKYLEKKYFAEINVSDEGNYWKTMDKTILQERFDEYTQLIDSVKGALKKENWQITDAPFHLSDKIEDLLNSRKTGLN